MKTCNRCDETKAEDLFPSAGTYKGKTSIRSYCKACDNARRSRDYHKDPEASREAMRASYAKNRESRQAYDQHRYANDPSRRSNLRKSNLKKQGWSPEASDAALDSQGGRCPICSAQLISGRSGNCAAHHDHNHATGMPRAILCALCNKGLGKFRDTPEFLRRAADYLEHHDR